MILNRIKTGALRTGLLINKRLNKFSFQIQSKAKFNSRLIVKQVRNVATLALIVRVVTMPIPTVSASSMVVDDSGPVPKPLRIDGNVSDYIHFAPDNQNLITISNVNLTNVNIGVSHISEQEEIERQKEAQVAEALKAAELAAKQKTVKKTSVLPTVVMDKGEVQEIAKNITVQAFGESEWSYMNTLILRESGYNPNSVNKSSGACGLPQALPCSKLQDKSVSGQVTWMINYVKNRYGTPSKALSFHNSHNWY